MTLIILLEVFILVTGACLGYQGGYYIGHKAPPATLYLRSIDGHQRELYSVLKEVGIEVSEEQKVEIESNLRKNAGRKSIGFNF